jgi:hypothetical protein
MTVITALWATCIGACGVLGVISSFYTGCKVDQSDHEALKWLSQVDYWIYTIRNFMTLVITCYYSWRVQRNEDELFSRMRG